MHTLFKIRFLPVQSNFKREVKETQQYNRIKQVLKDSISQSYPAFLAFAGHIFEGFVLKFQSEVPVIHLLYPAMDELLSDLLTKFVKKHGMSNGTDNGTNVKLKPISELQVFKTPKQTEIGTKARCILSKLFIIPKPEQEKN